LANLTSKSPEALQAYLEGEVHFRQFDLAAAREAYTRAVEADSTFALAHYELSKAYWWPYDQSVTLSQQHIRRAVQLSDRLPARHAVLVRAFDYLLRQTPDAAEFLRQAVQTYPDEAEAWYLLGEILFHHVGALATAEEIDQAFERAVELDPRNEQYLWHYTELAWKLHGDSALAAQRLEMLERVDFDVRHARAGRLALDLAFGDSVAQTAAMARLRSEGDWRFVREVRVFLNHPRYAAHQPVTRLWYELSDDDWRGRLAAFVLFGNNAYWYGRLREALPHLDDPAITAGWRARAAYRAFIVGLPIPEETLEQALEPALIDSVAPRFAVFHAGAFAADHGRWSDHANAIAELERRAERAWGEADSLTAKQNGGAVRALEGYGLWRRGQPTAALPMLEDPDALNWPWLVVPLWLGRLYQELGRLRDAERVYRSYVALDETLSIDPLSQHQLGKIYEQLEEYDKARESYQYFVHYWQDADPELQPMVEEARRAIIRVEGLRRE
jgi:tetratricopeptide (TPR) repeat protein